MESIWEMSGSMPKFAKLSGDRKTRVLIIGGGITGLLCAYQLQRAGVDYLLVEQDNLCGKVTKNTTAKITVLHGAIYSTMLERFGVERSKQYIAANEHALAEYRELCHVIPCDYQEASSYVYSINNREQMEREVYSLRKLVVDAYYTEKVELPFPLAGAVCVHGQAQFHPIRFLSKLSENLNICEHTKVTKVEGTTAYTSEGKIFAEEVIFATHFPFVNTHGSYFLKMYQHRSYVLVLANAPKLSGMYCDEASDGLSFRSYGDWLLLGGGGHRTGKQGGSYGELQAFAKKYYESAKEVTRYATQDCKTLDDIPYIGRYSKQMEHWYVATGYNKWGMTQAMVAAILLTDMVQGKKNEWEEIFSPSRSMLRPQLMTNAYEAVAHLVKPGKKRCPHLGCTLNWNSAERTWDCACHGSRFAENGELLDNPATGGLK